MEQRPEFYSLSETSITVNLGKDASLVYMLGFKGYLENLTAILFMVTKKRSRVILG